MDNIPPVPIAALPSVCFRAFAKILELVITRLGENFDITTAGEQNMRKIKKPVYTSLVASVQQGH
jgi:hypothetical protein